MQESNKPQTTPIDDYRLYKDKINPDLIYKCVKDNLRQGAIDVFQHKKTGKLKIVPFEGIEDIQQNVIDVFLDRTKELLDKQLIADIGQLDRAKPIILSGGSDDEVRLITAYIYLTHPVIKYDPEAKIDTYEYDKWAKGYDGRILFREERYINREVLFLEQIRHCINGGMLLLRGDVEEGVFSSLRSIGSDGKGVLIISNTILSDSFTSNDFQIIRLKSQAGIPKDIVKQEKDKDISLKYDKERYILFTNKDHLLLVEDRKALFEWLFNIEHEINIQLLCTRLIKKDRAIRKTMSNINSDVKNKFGINNFIFNTKRRSGKYCLNPKPKEGIFGG